MQQKWIRRGDVFYVYPGESTGSEQQGGRPAVVVSNDSCNRNSGVIEVVFLTTKDKKPLPTHVIVYATGKRSTALCEQIHSVSVERVGNYKGSCTFYEMRQIEGAIMCSLGIDLPADFGRARPFRVVDEGIKNEDCRIFATY